VKTKVPTRFHVFRVSPNLASCSSDGSYFDDGREIFDAESDEDELPGSRKSKKSRSKATPKEKSAKTSDIRDMLKAATGKKKPQVRVRLKGKIISVSV
jgi:hypothetical protein